MTLKPVDFAVVSQHALVGIDHADGFAFGFGNRTFPDLQFDKAREFLRNHRIATTIARQSSASATVMPSASLRDKISFVVKDADIGRRRHHWLCKAGASSLVHLTMLFGNISSKTD
jgi:hypothetical protein